MLHKSVCFKKRFFFKKLKMKPHLIMQEEIIMNQVGTARFRM